MARGSGICGLKGCDCEDEAALRLSMPDVYRRGPGIDPVSGEFVGFSTDYREWSRNS